VNRAEDRHGTYDTKFSKGILALGHWGAEIQEDKSRGFFLRRTNIKPRVVSKHDFAAENIDSKEKKKDATY
jgi:hypothetical protein